MINEDSPFFGHVDHVVVMTCTKYKKRQECIGRELARVGITDYQKVVQPDSPIPDYVIRGMRNKLGHVAARIWFNHHTAVRLCYDLGYEHVMLLEDDTTFLRDTGAIRLALGELKGAYSIVSLDPTIMSSACHTAAMQRGRDMGLKSWGVIGTDATTATCPRCAGCRILDRAAIAEYVKLHECIFTGECPDGVAYPADTWHPNIVRATGKPMAYAFPPLTVQGLSAELGPCTAAAHARYISYGVDVSLYGDQQTRCGRDEAGAL